MRRRVGAFLLAAVLLAGLALPVFAEQEEQYAGFDRNEGWQGLDDSILPASEQFLGPVPGSGGTNYEAPSTWEAVYLGVQGYGTVSGSQKEHFRHRFCVNGKEYIWAIDSKKRTYPIQNQLEEGSIYDVTVANGIVSSVKKKSGSFAGTVTGITSKTLTVDGKKLSLPPLAQVWSINTRPGGASVSRKTLADVKKGSTVRIFMNRNNQVDRIYLTPVGESYIPPVKGVPGKKTLKNFLSLAMEPVGVTLYVYGGNWDWAGEGGFPLGEEIGVSPARVEFFRRQDENYTYERGSDPSRSYYPSRGWHQYYFAGMDCSGYVGWVLYNLMNTKSGGRPYVSKSTYMAQRLAERDHLGTMDYGQPGVNSNGEACRSFGKSKFYPGDVFSMNGHVWISLGQCADGSVLILHSTPSPSRSGKKGGGVQLTGVGKKNSQAHQLAKTYMSRYFPECSRRYEAIYHTWSFYTDVTGTAAGKFSWDTKNVLKDPQGYRNMTPEKILADLFCETPFTDVGRQDWFLPAVSEMYHSGHMAGLSKTKFAPQGKMTRAMLVQVLYSMAGKPSVKNPPRFKDVPAGAWYANAMGWAAQQGILKGDGQGRMHPEDDLTREQMAVILFAWAKKSGKPTGQRGDLSHYGDRNQISGWARDAMGWAVGAGLLRGYSSNRLAPKGVTTRAEAAQVLVNFRELG